MSEITAVALLIPRIPSSPHPFSWLLMGRLRDGRWQSNDRPDREGEPAFFCEIGAICVRFDRPRGTLHQQPPRFLDFGAARLARNDFLRCHANSRTSGPSPRPARAVVRLVRT